MKQQQQQQHEPKSSTEKDLERQLAELKAAAKQQQVSERTSGKTSRAKRSRGLVSLRSVRSLLSFSPTGSPAYCVRGKASFVVCNSNNVNFGTLFTTSHSTQQSNENAEPLALWKSATNLQERWLSIMLRKDSERFAYEGNSDSKSKSAQLGRLMSNLDNFTSPSIDRIIEGLDDVCSSFQVTSDNDSDNYVFINRRDVSTTEDKATGGIFVKAIPPENDIYLQFSGKRAIISRRDAIWKTVKEAEKVSNSYFKSSEVKFKSSLSSRKKGIRTRNSNNESSSRSSSVVKRTTKADNIDDVQMKVDRETFQQKEKVAKYLAREVSTER